MKILVDRKVIERACRQLRDSSAYTDQILVRDSYSLLLDVLENNPLPGKWVVIETRPMAMKDTVAEGMPEKYFARVDPKILTVVDSEKEGWIYRDKSIPENRWRYIDVVKVENDTDTC